MIYEYECPSGHRFEVLKMKPEPKPTEPCPDCFTDGKRIYSVPAIVTTGEGYDETVGHWSSSRDKHEKMRLLGISPKDGCGSLTRVTSRHAIQEERVAKGLKEGGI